MAEEGKFSIEAGVEDVHSQVEKTLTEKLGDTGKKVHTGRSRNDQVAVDLHLYIRDEIRKTVIVARDLFNALMMLGKEHQSALMPGYTHYQVAMPASFGLWFTSFAEDITDDLILLAGCLSGGQSKSPGISCRLRYIDCFEPADDHRTAGL